MLDNGNPAVNALKTGETLSESFVYTLSDGTSSDDATLTITITGITDGVPGIVAVDANGAATGQNTVYEAGLGVAADETEKANGSVSVSALDGLSSVEIGGVVITAARLADAATTPVTVVTGKGTLTITGFTPSGAVGGVPTGGQIQYSYELASRQDHSVGAVADIIGLKVTDAGGDVSTGALTIEIIDHEPVASNDAASIVEGAASPVTGNVFGNGAAGDVADDRRRRSGHLRSGDRHCVRRGDRSHRGAADGELWRAHAECRWQLRL